MVSSGISWAMLLVMLLGGGGNDALDYLQTNAFWKAKSVQISVDQMVAELAPVKAADVAGLIKQMGDESPKKRDAASDGIRKVGISALDALKAAQGSDDPEIASRARILVTELTAAQNAAGVRRLMAIRTLGELKKPEGLPVLKAQLDSKEPFVADYAKAAIAAIEGKTAVRPAPSSQQLLDDVWMLPAKIDVVAQGRMALGTIPTIDQLLGVLPPTEGTTPGQIADNIAKTILPTLEAVGNVRLHSVTFGVYSGDANDPGHGMFVINADYDSHAAAAALRANEIQSQTLEGMEVFELEPGTALMLVSDHRAIMLVGPETDSLPFKEVAAVLKEGTGKLKTNEALSKMVRTATTQATAKRGLWAVTQVRDAMREGMPDPLAPFNSATLLLEEKGGAMSVLVDAMGSDAAKVKAAVEEAKKGLAETAGEMKEQEAMMPSVKPLREFLESLKIEANGAHATITGSLKTQSALLLGTFVGAGVVAVPPPGAVAVPPPVQMVPASGPVGPASAPVGAKPRGR